MQESEPKKPLDLRVLSWLQEQGYSLEMRVARIFKEAGFEVSQFGYYIDPESQTSREIDVIASIGRQVGDIYVSINLFVECKYARKKPWVIFTAPYRSGPFFYFSRIIGEKPNPYEWEIQPSFQGRLLSSILLSLGRERMDRLRFFDVPECIGYGFTEAFRAEGQDNIYTAMMQISKCVEARDIEVEQIFDATIQAYESGRGSDVLRLSCGIAFPIIVIDGKLFECYLNPANEFIVSEVEKSAILWSSKTSSEMISNVLSATDVIQILTEASLQSFARAACQAAQALLSQDSAIIKLWQYESQKLRRTRDSEAFPEF